MSSIHGKKIALVLGGTIPHKTLLENLNSRGYYTVLLDYYDNPPAKIAADRHIKESTLDKEKVLEIAAELNADLVISTSIDQANATACYVAEKLNLPKPYTYETALEVTNKLLMKQKLIANGIPTTRFVTAEKIEDVEGLELLFPVVVKPVDATGSKGVRKVEELETLKTYLTEALEISRDGRAIVEEFFDGKEIQVDFLVQKKDVSLVMTREKVKTPEEGNSVLQSVGSIVPANISENAVENTLAIARKIVEVFELDNTSLFIQAIVQGDYVNVIEFACRIGGGLSYSMIKIITGFDILDATVDTFLGIPSVIKYKRPEMMYSTNLIYAQPGIFGEVSGYKEILDKGIIEEFYFFKTKGMSIGQSMTSGDRVCGFLLKANDREGLREKSSDAIKLIKVYDVDGKELKKRKVLF